MKHILLTTCFLALCCCMVSEAIAQPFTLDKKLKVVKLQLENQKDWKGAKGIAGVGKLSQKGEFFYVKGASMFQPIDVFLVGPDGKNARLEIVKNNWEDIELKGSTTDSPDGIANLKLRSYGDFGIRVYSDTDEGDYQLVVYASPEVKNNLPSPFVKMEGKKEKPSSKNSAATGEEKPKTENVGGQSNSIWIAGGIIAVLLVIILVLLKNKKGKTLILLAPISILLQPTPLFAQSWQMQKHLSQIKEIMESKNAENILKKLKELKEQGVSIKELLEAYTGIGDCMDLPMPPGMPSIPSFCPDEEEGAASTVSDSRGDCARCFVEARGEFEKVRYNLEQLRVIYKCTKDFSKKAIAFGDNTSGIHAVSGLAWQAQKVKIEGSVKDMEKAYDLKYTELIGKLQESLIALAVCEEQFGTPDWYDRYGYMFYEFVKEKYKRSGE
ncbi:hypothetical protein L0U88_19440 [Flavihumibacter sp. RY-1]|uniref:Uncharacterized protein n=1 Tax=Flavihumibacter fluminis TaxID=2909236 RepID=A0ABS9BMF6_9BACT|nr:hypothetical protein [Flavihumibacter fluminis]MCF1716825.1 hypothetical protein [Flavihumibacter fluminis]